MSDRGKSRIVTSTYRYKRPPRKRTAQAAAIAVPAIVRRGVKAENDNRPEPEPKSRIVTARKPRGSSSDAPDLTPEEHQQRGDAADALFRELVRRAGKGS
jgi:hypothetical protein